MDGVILEQFHGETSRSRVEDPWTAAAIREKNQHEVKADKTLPFLGGAKSKSVSEHERIPQP